MRFTRPPFALAAAILAFAGSTSRELQAQDGRSAAPQPAQPFSSSRTAAEPAAETQGSMVRASSNSEIARLAASAEQASTNGTAWVKLADALMQKSRETIDNTLYDRAISAYQKALAQDPRNEDALVGLAWVHNTRHEFDEGRAWAEKALALNARLPHAHALLGDAAVELGDYDAALDHYQNALDIRPDLSSYSRAAHLVWLMGDARKGRWLMEKAIKAGGPYAENTAWCRAELALMLWQDGALLPAEQQAEAALKNAPTNAHVLATMGKIKTARKEYDKAIDSYQRAVEITPAHDSLVALGDLYALKNQSKEAEAQYSRLVDLHKTGAAYSHLSGAQIHSHGNAQLARFYADHDRNLDDALREARLAYRDYKNVFVADTLAWCYYKMGQFEVAGKTIRKALRWNTPDAAILFHAGMIHAKLGEGDTAKKFLSHALSLNPQFNPRDSALAAETLKMLAGPAHETQPAEYKQ